MTGNLGQAPRLATTRDPETARVKTENGSTATALGRTFRSYTPISLNSGQEYALRITTPINVNILSIALNVTAGEVLYEGLAAPTSATGFNDVRPVYALNQRDDLETPYTPQLVVEGGGVIVGGIQVEVVTVRTGTNNQRASILEEALGGRGVPPGVYYIRMTGQTNGTEFTIYSTWEEL